MAYYDTTWYANSVGYTAVTAWAATTAVVAGALRRQLAVPPVNSERVFICIVAGTTGSTEPTWVLTRGAKTTDGTATWMECTGIAALNGDITNTVHWSAIAAIGTPSLGTIIQRNSGASYQICTTAGTLGAAEPSFSDTAGVTTTETSATTVWTSLGVVGNFTGGQAPHARLANVFTVNWFAAGSTCYVGDNHAESQVANLTIGPSGSTTVGKLLCHNHSGSYPPTSLTTGATVTCTGPSTLQLSPQAGFYVYGVIFQGGSGANDSFVVIGPSVYGIYLDNCSLQLTNTNASAIIQFGGGGAYTNLTLNNTSLKFGNVGQTVSVVPGIYLWCNTTPGLAPGSSVPSSLFFLNSGSTTPTVVVEAVDLSTITGSLINFNQSMAGSFLFKDCKIGSTTPIITPLTTGFIGQLVRSDSGAAAYKSSRYAYEGTETTETSITRVGGASDPTGQAQSRKIVTTANSQWLLPFKAEPYAIWNAKTAANVTVTVCGTVNAGALPNNDDIWMDVEYLALTGAAAAAAAAWEAASAHNVTLSGSNLVVTNTGTTSTDQGAHVPLAGALGTNVGKYYFEITLTTFTGGAGVGVALSDGSLSYSSVSAGPTWGQICFVVGHTGTGTIFSGVGGNLSWSLGALTSGDVICVAVDTTSTNRRVWFRKGAAGPWNGSGSGAQDPTAGNNLGGGVPLIAGAVVPYVTFGSGGVGGAAGVAGNVFTANFGASSFVGTPPSGYTAGWPNTPAIPGSLVGTIVNTTKANLLAANAAVASDSSTWNNIPAFVSWNPSDLVSVTLTGSNLVATLNANNGGVRSTLGPSSGKFYWEITPNASATTNVGFGVALGSVSVGTIYVGAAGTAQINSAGNISVNGSVVVNSIGLPTAATAVCIALDLTAGLIWFRASPTNNWNGSSSNNPATGVGGVSISSIMTGPLYPSFSAFSSGAAVTANFGGSAFSGTVPSGFTAGVSALWTPFKLVATLSSPQPGQAGLIYVRPNIAKPSATFYLDPNPVLS